MKAKTKKILLICFIPAIIILYLIACTLLFFFEPSVDSDKILDFSKASYSFDAYRTFDKKNNADLYIKQISAEDVKPIENSDLMYIDNVILVVAEKNAKYDEVLSCCEKNNFKLCGYVKNMNLYQFNSDTDLSYGELVNKCSDLTDIDIIKYASPDYFQPSPGASVSEPDSVVLSDNSKLYEAANICGTYSNSECKIGMIDVPVAYSNNSINVMNSSEYSDSILYSGEISGVNHGTHVASVISSICRNSGIYSYNGLNNTDSYWLAAICKMITVDNVKVINISMGYDSKWTAAASYGNQNALDYYNNEASLFGGCLKSLLDYGYDYVICDSAGNGNNDVFYKDNSLFGLKDNKKLLTLLDCFNIFPKEKGNLNAEYIISFSAINDIEVKNRIIVVGSYSIDSMTYSSFSNEGDRVDIAAPGENVFGLFADGNVAAMTGTSVSAPIVSATAAIMFSENETLSGKEVKDTIISAAKTNVKDKNGNYYPVLNSDESILKIIGNK